MKKSTAYNSETETHMNLTAVNVIDTITADVPETDEVWAEANVEYDVADATTEDGETVRVYRRSEKQQLACGRNWTSTMWWTNRVEA